MDAARFEELKTKISDLVEKRLPMRKTVNIPGHLFHYTDANGLLGILGNHELWATHYRYLNDTGELLAGEKAVTKAIGRYAETATGERNKLLKSIGKYLEMRPLSSVAELFVTSFSERGNDLSQWRAYGSDGAGYSIGFEVVPLEGQVKGVTNGTILECLYRTGGDGKVRGIVDVVHSVLDQAWGLFEDFERILQSANGELSPAENAALVEPIVIGATRLLASTVLDYKNKRFRSEKEWRLCMLREPKEMASCHYRSDGRRIVPYEIVSFKDNSTLRVRELYVGPGVDIKRRLKSARWLLEKAGYPDVQPKPSGIPYVGKQRT